jgi:DNA gyrase subunit A
MGGKTRDEDFIEHLFVASTHDTLLIFTEKGRCYWLSVFKIPETDKNAKGRAIQNLVQIPGDDKIRTILDVSQNDMKEPDGKFILLCTREGIIKKTPLADFSRPRSSGVNAITIREEDQLLEVAMTDGESIVMMAVRSGRAISFPEDKVRPTGRGAIGVTGIELNPENDAVVGMVTLSKAENEKQILVVSEKGLGKRTPVYEPLSENASDEDKAKAVTLKDDESGQLYELSYRITGRGGKGVKTINITEKTGALVGLLAVKPTDDLMITCKSGITIRMKVENIREAGRATQGVKLINLDETDEIAAIARIEEQEEDEAVMEDTLTGNENETVDNGSSDDDANATTNEPEES